jgi:hypothetical protein
MTRRRYAFDEARVQRFLAERRGIGVGRDYRPWLQIQDVPSSGRSHRPYGIKTQRVHHLLSDGEWKCFLRFEADPMVVDVQEQFPMDRMGTFREAHALGVRHPRTLDGTPYVMTIDFLVTRATSTGLVRTPYTFKYDPETLAPRERELMSITQAFWAGMGSELQVLDQSFFDEAFNINYDSVRAYHDISELTFYRETDVAGIARHLFQAAAAATSDTLLQACRWFSSDFRTTPHVVYQIAMHLVSNGLLRVDLSSQLGLEQLPLSAYTVVQRAK